MRRTTQGVGHVLVCVAAGMLGAVAIGGQQPPAAGVFTAGQAAAGRQAYDAGCASCHRPDLAGGNEAPPLAGVNFMNAWRTRSPRELAEYIQVAMPPTGPMPSREQSLSIAAFILQSNGAQAGAEPLTLAAVVSIGAIASGQVQTAQPNAAPAGQPAGAPIRGVRGGATELPPGRGLTVAGEVQDYVPVTDAMLRDPPDVDWIMIRLNYQAWSYSPLTGITPDNVQRLRLAWVWAMSEGGANEPTPIVHNGTILSGQHRQPGASARWPHRRADLGTQRGARSDHRSGRHAQYGAL